MACKVCDKVKCIYRYKVASEFEDGRLADMVVDEAAKYCPECGRRIYKEVTPEPTGPKDPCPETCELNKMRMCTATFCSYYKAMVAYRKAIMPEHKTLCPTTYCGLNIDGVCAEGHAQGLYCNRLCKEPKNLR